MKQVYILAPCRTAIGSFGGALAPLNAARLGAAAIIEVLKRAGVAPAEVDQVLLGNVLQAGQGQNPARQAAVQAGLPVEVPAMTLNRVCGSGLAAVSMAAALVRAGEADCVVAGGMESMSNAPYLLPALRGGARMGDTAAVDSMVHDGLWDAFGDIHMGITAENIAEKYGITREEQDAFAAESQRRAAEAREAGLFREEIFPVSVPQRKGDPVVFDADEYIRPGTTAEKLAGLRPAFKPGGTVTAGNASGINDGAAAMLVVSEAFVEKHGIKPEFAYLGGACRGVEPALMGLGPVPAVNKALDKAGLTVQTIDIWEANEAFAAQSIAVCRDLGLPPERVNQQGGAIALGHPIGASGARVAVTLLHLLRRSKAQYGVATLCVGGGMGEAAVFQRL